MAGPGHAQTDLHSHWMGNAATEKMALELAKFKPGLAGDVSTWEPLLREIQALKSTDKGGELQHTRGPDQDISQRGRSGDAYELVDKAVEHIDELKLELASKEGADRAPIIEEIDNVAKNAVNKALRSSDETDFNSAYEIRDELIKNFYGTADRQSVVGDATTITQAKANLLDHFKGRPSVVKRIKQVVEGESKAARGKLDAKGLAALEAKRTLVLEQFAYDRYAVDTVVRLAQDKITYTEQSNSAKKLLDRFDEQQLAFVKDIAKREHPELAADLDRLTVKYLAMITTNNFGLRNGDVQDVHPGARERTTEGKFKQSAAEIKELAKRGDVVGMDVAGMEHFQFDARGQKRFQQMFGDMFQLGKARGEPVVFRPHVGEGAINVVTGKPFATDANRQVNAQGEPLHVVRARENIGQLLTALEGVAANFGGNLPPEVVVRFGHATHATPEQAARIKALGIIVEVNLTSNQVTGSMPIDQPLPGQQD